MCIHYTVQCNSRSFRLPKLSSFVGKSNCVQALPKVYNTTLFNKRKTFQLSEFSLQITGGYEHINEWVKSLIVVVTWNQVSHTVWFLVSQRKWSPVLSSPNFYCCPLVSDLRVPEASVAALLLSSLHHIQPHPPFPLLSSSLITLRLEPQLTHSSPLFSTQGSCCRE